MPIEYRTGNIFDSGADVLVCPVNCVGVMGAGLAKQFAKRMPWGRTGLQAGVRGYAHEAGRWDLARV